MGACRAGGGDTYQQSGTICWKSVAKAWFPVLGAPNLLTQGAPSAADADHLLGRDGLG